MTEEKRVMANRLLIPRSYMTTESNKTGSWRFLRPRYDEKTAPCSSACPAGEDIARVEMLTSQGAFKEAWETILLENPLPAVCGRVCFHPCERVCNRGEFDQPIAIHNLERFLADTASRYNLEPEIERLPSKREKIAVVGSGPSGLAAAYFLSILGYACDVYERLGEPGGVLRWGIPSYRLPPKIVAEEIARIGKMGCRIHCNNTIARDFLEGAKKDYDAVFLGCGQSRIPDLEIPGEEPSSIADGLSFLQEIKSGNMQPMEGPVAVIGGGNTAMDVARSALRLGGKPIVLYRRRREDMPAFDEEIEMALEEGVELEELRVVTEIRREGSEFVLTVQPTEVVGLDPQGRARVELVREEKKTLRVSKVFKAIGLAPAEAWLQPPAETEGVLKLSNSVLVCSEDGIPVVYGGDLTAGIKSVVHAVASGKEAAMAFDVLFQKGFQSIPDALKSASVGNGPSLSMEIYIKGPRCRRNPHVVAYNEINTDYFQLNPRIVQPRLLKEERFHSFAEIDLKISANLAMREAERCFNCGICNQCDNCRLFCPDLAVLKSRGSTDRHIDYDFCKGCGICVVECPRNAMVLEQED